MLRFKTDEGIEFPNCKRMKMKDIFVEIIDKKHPTMPVLSVQQGMGTILRDKSNRNINYNKTNLDSYKAMKKGDFIIHLRSFEGGLECSNYDGISSPAYKILRTNKLIPEAYKGYFRTYNFIEGKLSAAVVGIRDGKNIDMPTFWENDDIRKRLTEYKLNILKMTKLTKSVKTFIEDMYNKYKAEGE